MPLIKESSYQPPWWGKNPHLSTIIPSVFRNTKGMNYDRERIDTPDGDFIDLDWLKGGNDQLVVLLHGLEGSSDRGYMRGMAKYFHDQNWDVVAYNSRGCSGEINKLPRLYHHGDTDDVDCAIQYINAKNDYRQIAMIGFSMGGSLTLNYLGNEKHQVAKNISTAVAYSVPCDVKASAVELEEKGNGFYRRRFLRKLSNKIKAKAKQFPDLINVEGIDKIDNFYDFETRYTAPLHGFESADAFYKYASAKNYLKNIKVTTLIASAANDPMFSQACYPIEEVRDLDNVYLEIPKYGGHVGFSQSRSSANWMEVRAWQFINDLK